MLARMQLAAALRGSGNVMQSATEIACGDVKPGGMLAAASREQQGDMSIDAGLFPLIWPLHQASSKAGTSCQVGMAAGVNCAAQLQQQEVQRCRTSAVLVTRVLRWHCCRQRWHMWLPPAWSWMSTVPHTSSHSCPFTSWRCSRARC